jgi:hypothetical protein
MTAKQAIKARCLDGSGNNCTDTKCPLFGLMKPKAGVNRIDAIRRYCYWCMNRTPINQCASPCCGIYQYRVAAKGNIGVSFLPISPSKDRIDGNGDDCNTKTMSTCTSENEGLRNVNSDD